MAAPRMQREEAVDLSHHSTPGRRLNPFSNRVKWLLGISLLINLGGAVGSVFVVHGRGGAEYLKIALRLSPPFEDPAQVTRARYASYSTPDFRPIVFLGDSLTDQNDWWDAFDYHWPILNRGIGGDTTAGVAARLSTISKLKPKAVFLMIGTNDGLMGLPPEETYARIREITSALVQAVPDCEIYVQSVLPSISQKFAGWGNRLNALLPQVASGQVHFVNIRPAFEGSNGLLKPEYTRDGIHLNARGYEAWKAQLLPLMEKHPEWRCT